MQANVPLNHALKYGYSVEGGYEQTGHARQQYEQVKGWLLSLCAGHRDCSYRIERE